MKIGIIGGTGLDNPDIMSNITEFRYEESQNAPAKNGEPAQYGEPSDPLVTGEINGVGVALLGRHGRDHRFSPTNVNYRANLLSLRNYGCDLIIATYSVGSLREDYRPGDFAVLDQVIDRTQKRNLTFFDGKDTSFGGVCHVSFGDPYSPELREVLIEAVKKVDFTVHSSATAVAVEGPRFSSRAESKLYQSWCCDVVGMTQVPEAQLARELHIPFVGVAMVTDYDCWREGEESVTQESVCRMLSGNRDKMIQFIREVIPVLKERFTPSTIKKSPGEGDLLG